MGLQFPIALQNSNIKNYTISFLQIIAGSLLIALCARIQIPLPFTPVPLTCQTLAIMFLGITLGSKKGAASALLYLLEASAGLPVLAGGAINALALIGPRCGYLLGMPLQAYIAGRIVENKTTSSVKIALGLAAACAIQLGMGVCGLAHFVGIQNVLLMGFLPFIPGELLKVFLVTNYLKLQQR